MSKKIQETDDYGRFVLHGLNRAVTNLKKLMESMKKYGFLDAYPIYCYMHTASKTLVIKDGHHRFEAAKALGLPVKYVVLPEHIDPSFGEISGKPWNIHDCAGAYARQGIQPYKKVLEYSQRTGINLSASACLLAGTGANAFSNLDKKFKEGKFLLANDKLARMVEDIVLHMREEKIAVATTQNFINALSRICFIEEFSPAQFKKKCSVYKSMFEKQPTMDAYSKLIETVYNRGSSKVRLNLSFMADELARGRNVVIGRLERQKKKQAETTAGKKAVGIHKASASSLGPALF